LHLAPRLSFDCYSAHRDLHSFPTRRSSDLSGNMSAETIRNCERTTWVFKESLRLYSPISFFPRRTVEDVELEGFMIPENTAVLRSEEHTSELQSRENLVCRLLLEKKKQLQS